MPDYLHRTNLILLHSVASADLPEPESNYILYPDLSAVEGQPTKYWENISGDNVTLMDAAARAVVDADEKAARNTAEIDALDNVIVRALLEEINALKVNAGMQIKTFDEIKPTKYK